jgi:parvulin-like peptidyl-prolyl isomerase
MALAILMLSSNVDANQQETDAAKNLIFAQIDDLIITETEFEEIFLAAVRYKYYHGRVPKNELLKFKQKVSEDIVIQVIVHRDAQKKGLEPDHEKIAQGLNEYDNKYADSPEWQGRRYRVMPLLTKRLERQNLLEKMEAKIKNIPQPEADQIADYYKNNVEKFTEPERVWGSIIMLKVPPSADEITWTGKIDAAEQLKHRVEKGEEFSALAKQHSAHASAVNGGDLGYLHQGMLDEGVQETVEALDINQISDPIRVLEGIVLFRLNGVQTEKLKPFDEVKQRAAGLLHRELQDKAWDNYVGDLKASANIYVNEKLYVQNNHE